MASVSITSHPSSVNPSSDFDVSGSFAGCASPTITASMNGSPLAVTTPDVSGGAWSVVITSGACEEGQANTIIVKAQCGGAQDVKPITVNCQEDANKEGKKADSETDGDEAASSRGSEDSQPSQSSERKSSSGEGDAS